MPKPKAVWGIDIGHSAFKALRCREGDGGLIIADSYDYIEYPKVLGSPDADPDKLVHDALETFLSRNTLTGDYVGMCVSGQSGLSRFFKPPPVDAKTLPDIVKYEVKQQIPFPIEDVVWDWQALGGTDVDGMIVDSEVGLFAIKRDTVFGALQPFIQADLEVDLVQLAPLATLNVISHDILEVPPDGTSPEDNEPPESVVVLSIGTDATDLIVTNGMKLWLRNIPIGGNHFTKQLSRELKLTQAKAEHLKRNARQAEDPKQVFQAMRPVFSDLATEVNRSLTFYQGIDKSARIQRIVLLGNGAKLPGLRQFLNAQLELDIAKVGSFRKLTGDTVVNDKTFSDNVLAFAPCYGLCLQGLRRGYMKTNLLPQEFVTERMIRAKKPWVLASVGILMLGMLISYFAVVRAWWQVHPEFATAGTSWAQAASEVDRQASISTQFKEQDDALKTKLERINRVSMELSAASEVRSSWLDLMSAISQILPRDPRIEGRVVDPVDVPFEDRTEIYVRDVESEFFQDLSSWVQAAKPRFEQQLGLINTQAERAGLPVIQYEDTTLREPGWVVQIRAHHFHNSEQARRASRHGAEFVREALLRPMLTQTIQLPVGDNQTLEEFTLRDLGVYFPTVVAESPLERRSIPNPFHDAPRPQRGPEGEDNGNGEAPAPGAQAVPEEFRVTEFRFTLQMAWVPSSRQQYMANRQARLEREARPAVAGDQTLADEAD